MFGLYPPEQKFTITITIEQLAYSRKDDDDVWTPVSTLEIGPLKRIAKSEDFSVCDVVEESFILFNTQTSLLYVLCLTMYAV